MNIFLKSVREEMRIRIVGSGEYAQYSLEYDVLRSTTVMMVKVQIMVELFALDEAVEAISDPAIGTDTSV